MRLYCLRAGLYETDNGVTIEHRPDLDGMWYVTYPERHMPDDVYHTLSEARDALQSENA